MANMWNLAIQNLGGVVATIILIIYFFYDQHASDISFLSKMIITFVPLAIALLTGIFSRDK